MNEKNKNKDPIPESFANIEEAAAFWDQHSLADYWDQTREAEVEVRAPRRQWIPLASNLSQRAIERAQKEGVSVDWTLDKMT